MTGKKRRHPLGNSPGGSEGDGEEDTGEQSSTSTAQSSTKRRGSVAADFASHRAIVSERQQMAVLKQLTAGDEVPIVGSQSPSSSTTHSNIQQHRPSKINRRNEHGETILHIAARKGDLKQLKKMLQAGANINEADNAGWTPLHEAVTKNQFRAARLLLKSGADSNALGSGGQTPIVDAVLNNNVKMAELLLKYSADMASFDLTRLDETMAKVLKREMSVLDSSDNENDDESISPLSPLTSADSDHDDEIDKTDFHASLIDPNDKNTTQPISFTKIQRKKPYRRLRERSSQSSDSSTHSKSRRASSHDIQLSKQKNPYDFDSDEEEGEIRETTTNEKKKQQMQTEGSKQRANSGGSITMKKRTTRTGFVKQQEQQQKSASDDEHLHQIYRVPPLKIVLARAVLQKSTDIDDMNPFGSTDECNNSSLTMTMATSSEVQPFMTSTSSTNVITSEVEEKKVRILDRENEDITRTDDNRQKEKMISPADETFSRQSDTHKNDKNKEENDPISPASPSMTVSTVLDTVITQIALTIDTPSVPPLPIEEPMEEGDDDGEEDDAEEEEEEEQESKITNIEKERPIPTKSLSRRDLKPTTRTLRSHARGKSTMLSTIQMSANNNNNDGRRVSNRRRALEKKLLAAREKQQYRKTTQERSRKERETSKSNASSGETTTTAVVDDAHASSNSDDQITENPNGDKVTRSTTTTNANDDASSCSSNSGGDGSTTSSSTTIAKQSHTNADLDLLPPNKRRLRERNAASSTVLSNTSSTVDSAAVSTSNSAAECSPTESTTQRDIPTNCIKKFLQIREQIDKRHEVLMHESVVPKVPKDFADSLMAKKNYLIAPSSNIYPITTPAMLGIQRLMVPSDLDQHLAEVFTRQEDERYRMKLRHQVERDKLILSHEQEVLRLYGNATRSSINQDLPFSYCSLLKDSEVYNMPSVHLAEKERGPLMIGSELTTGTELGKRGKHRWNGRFFIKWLDDSNLKYKRLSCELNQRQRLEADTLYSMQRMVWSQHLHKEAVALSSSGRTSNLLTERYLPIVEINSHFWTHWETCPF